MGQPAAQPTSLAPVKAKQMGIGSVSKEPDQDPQKSPENPFVRSILDEVPINYREEKLVKAD